MRRLLGVLAGLTILCCLYPAVKPVSGQTSSQSQKKKKKSKSSKKKTPSRAAPKVSASAKAASLERVSAELDNPGYFQQTGAMVPFFEQIHQSVSSEKKPPIHILHFGDSHTAADDWTGTLRALFQKKFGDGGSGYSLAGYPFKGYRRYGEHFGGTTAWKTEGLRSANGDGYFGLGGVSISTERAGQSVFIEAECEHLELFYLEQPGGGEVALYDGDTLLKTFSTSGELKPAAVELDTTPGQHRFTLRTLQSRPVRLFGWVADKKSGVTYESLGINGAEASVMFRWDEAMLSTYIQRRDPALIVLAYGTNEAGDPNWNRDNYYQMFSALLQRLRKAAPIASILVIGPPDRLIRTKAGWKPMTQVDKIVEAQKDACRENGAAFWDTRERMGGTGSMRDWVYAGLGQGDYVHFTSAGYQRLALGLFSDILQQFQIYNKARTQLSSQATNGDTNTNH